MINVLNTCVTTCHYVLSFMAILGFKIYYRGTCGLVDGKYLGIAHHLFMGFKTAYDSVRREV